MQSGRVSEEPQQNLKKRHIFMAFFQDGRVNLQQYNKPKKSPDF